jgi:1-deoxy-D-xylulose-5-phosphate synthase
LASEGYDAALINPRFIKPLDAGLTDFFGRAAEVLVTLEDHVLMGGYGSAVLELFNEKRITTPVVQIGWPDQFIEHATNVEDLRQKYGLTVDAVGSRRIYQRRVRARIRARVKLFLATKHDPPTKRLKSRNSKWRTEGTG